MKRKTKRDIQKRCVNSCHCKIVDKTKAAADCSKRSMQHRLTFVQTASGNCSFNNERVNQHPIRECRMLNTQHPTLLATRLISQSACRANRERQPTSGNIDAIRTARTSHSNSRSSVESIMRRCATDDFGGAAKVPFPPCHIISPLTKSHVYALARAFSLKTPNIISKIEFTSFRLNVRAHRRLAARVCF